MSENEKYKLAITYNDWNNYIKIKKTKLLRQLDNTSYLDNSNPVISGYRASQSFSITVRAAATAGAVVDAIVDANPAAFAQTRLPAPSVDNKKPDEPPVMLTFALLPKYITPVLEPNTLPCIVTFASLTLPGLSMVY